MIQRSAPAFPEALDDDDDDVTWALQTAGVQWKRGAHADAIECLHRSVESSVDGGHAVRARQIQQQANSLEAALKSGWQPNSSLPAPPPPAPRPAHRNPFLDEGPERVPDPYSVLPVDIDVEASFELRQSSALPPRQTSQPVRYGSLPVRQSVQPPTSIAAEEVSDDELIEEVEDFEEDEIKPPASRMPFVSAPTLETGLLEDDEFLEPDDDDGAEVLPTLPPSVRGLAPPGKRHPTTPPRPPNLPPTAPSWPPPPSNRPATLPPQTPPPHAASWQKAPPSSRASNPSLRARGRSNVPERPSSPQVDAPPASRAPAPAPAPSAKRSRTPLASPPPPPRKSASPSSEPPPTYSVSPGPSERPAASDSPPSRQPRSNRRPSARALALEKKIAAAKALARQRMQETPESQPPDDRTERSFEAAPPSSNAPRRRTSTIPPDTEVSSAPPPEAFASVPPDETTERDFDGPPPANARLPRFDSIPDSEPGTAPNLTSPFARSDSAPPTSEQPLSSRRDSSQPPPTTESDPSLPPPSSEVSEPPPSIVVGEALLSIRVSEPPPSTEVSEPPPSTEVSEAPPSSRVSEPPPAQRSVQPLLAPQSVREAQGPRPTDISGIELGSVPGLEDLPEESQQDLVSAAELHTLAPDEEVSGFELALVIEGAVSVMPAIADVSAAQAKRGDLIFSQGHLDDGVPIRVVASRAGAKVASFSKNAFEAAVRDCPWVGDELKAVGDRLQALAGVAMGPMGEELDDMLRNLVIERCEVRRLLPNEVVAQPGKPVPGMVIVGAGRIEVVDEKRPAPLDELGPGSFLYAAQILQAAPAPHTARAGKEGALILFAERKVAHELMVSVPPLLGIFAR
jgi:hypothetical protein